MMESHAQNHSERADAKYGRDTLLDAIARFMLEMEVQFCKFGIEVNSAKQDGKFYGIDFKQAQDRGGYERVKLCPSEIDRAR